MFLWEKIALVLSALCILISAVTFYDANKHFAGMSGQISLKKWKKGQILSNNYVIIFQESIIFRAERNRTAYMKDKAVFQESLLEIHWVEKLCRKWKN